MSNKEVTSAVKNLVYFPLGEYARRASGFVKKNYLSMPVAHKAFSLKETGRNGIKANSQYTLYGLSAVGLKKVSDMYAQSPSMREQVSHLYDKLLPGDALTGAEGFVRYNLSFKGFHNNVIPEINNALHNYLPTSFSMAPGDVTDGISTVGAGLATLSLAYLGAKKIIRDRKKKRRENVESVTKRDMLGDVWDAAKNSPVSLALLSASAANAAALAAGGKGYAAAAISSVYKTAKDSPGSKRKGDSYFSKIGSKFSAWLDSDF